MDFTKAGSSWHGGDEFVSGRAGIIPRPHRSTSGLVPQSPIALHVHNYSHAPRGTEAVGKVAGVSCRR